MKKYLLPILLFPMVLCASVQDVYSQIKDALNKKRWTEVVRLSDKMNKEYKDSCFKKEVFFCMGKAYFFLDDPDLSNKYLTLFLKEAGSSVSFEEAIQYKYLIAEKFENGYYGHLFGVASLPKLESMWEAAYELYDEVVYTLPRSEVALKSLYNKGRMLLKDKNYDQSIEVYRTLSRKFPKHILGQKAYIQIARVYKEKVLAEYLDTKVYEFVLLNQKTFCQRYPNSTFQKEMEEQVQKITDLFAEDIYKSGLYFDKKDRYDSAAMYFRSLISKYPKSKYAVLATQKIATYELNKHFDEIKGNATILVGAE